MAGWRELAARATRPDATDQPSAPIPADSGLTKLRGMRRPAGSTPDRWAQIIADAELLDQRWGDQLAQFGWIDADLYGLDLAQNDDWRMGLVFAIRGGRVCLLSERSATILHPDGRTRQIHYREDGQPAPIWAQRKPR